MRKKFITGVLILALAGQIPVFAQSLPESDDVNDAKFTELDNEFLKKTDLAIKNVGAIGLSEKQITSLRSLRENILNDLQGFITQEEVIADNISSALWESPMNTALLNELISKKHAIARQEINILTDGFTRLNGILSPDQHEKLKEIWERDNK